MIVPAADQRRLSHILADDLQPRIEWAYGIEQGVAAGGDHSTHTTPLTGSEHVQLSPDGYATTQEIAGVGAAAGGSLAYVSDTTNVLVYAARTSGVAGNSLTVNLVNGGPSQSLSVSEVGNAVTVHLGTDGGSVVTSTQGEVAAILNTDSTLVTGVTWGTSTDLAAVAGPWSLAHAVAATSAPHAIASFPFTVQQSALPFEAAIIQYPWMAFADDEPAIAWGKAGDLFARVCMLVDPSEGWYFGDGTFDAYLQGGAVMAIDRSAQPTLSFGSGRSATYPDRAGLDLVAADGGPHANLRGALTAGFVGGSAHHLNNDTYIAGTLEVDGDLIVTGTVTLSGIPTADPHVVGQVWNSTGTLKISAG